MSAVESPIEPMRSLEGLNRKRAEVTNPRYLHMIDVLQEHVLAELAGDLDRIMKTLVAEPSYHWWGVQTMDHFVGQEATRSFYTMIFESGSNYLERTYDRLIIDDYGLFADGVIKIVVKGAMLEFMAQDRPDQDEIDLNGTYLSIQQSAVVLPFSEDGLMMGEDVYSDGKRELRKLS